MMVSISIFHSAKAGSKIDILNKQSGLLCHFHTTRCDESDLACNFEGKHKTVIGTGLAESFTEQEKIAVLDKIVGLFTTKRI